MKLIFYYTPFAVPEISIYPPFLFIITIIVSIITVIANIINNKKITITGAFDTQL